MGINERTSHPMDTTQICTAIAVIIAAYGLMEWLKARSLPPGPRGWPFIGCLLDLKPMPHHALRDMSLKYGNFMSLYMGQQLTIVLSSPEVLRDTIRDEQQSYVFSDRWINDFAKVSLHADEEGGKNVALANQNYWRKSRKIFVQELMKMSFIKTSCIPVLYEEINSTRDAIAALGKDQSFDPHTFLQRLSLNIVMRLTYGVRYASEEIKQKNSPMGQLLAVINEIVQLGSTGVMSNYIPIMKYFYKEIANKRKGLIGRRDAILLNFLKEHKENLDIDDPKDFLDVLLIRQPIDQLTDWEVTLIAWEFITAGTDTTSATMHWMSALMANHPEIQKKVFAEIDSVCNGRMVSNDDQAALPYTNAVIKEVMRLYPVVPLMVPYATSKASSVTLNSSTGKTYQIPKGTQVLVNHYAMARNPELWDEPDKFDPERFMCKEKEVELKAADAPRDPAAKCLKFIPMGTGRRACAGYALAKVELFLQAAMLLQCFEWSPPPGQDKIELKEKFGIAVSPVDFEINARFRTESGVSLGDKAS